ncbi:MAG: AraC family transcriptional regulator [Pseudomonadota bacterium]
MKDQQKPETTLNRFALKAEGERHTPFDGEPARELPEWGGVARGDGVRFILHPPLNFEIAYQIPDYFIFAPYSRAIIDVSVHDEPRRRRTWAAGSAFVVPPETRVRAKMADPVEFLCVIVAPERAEAVFERTARGRLWSPQLIEEFVDPGFAALHHEVRRSLLGDPLMEPAYLEAIADSMMARVGCRLAGAAIGSSSKEAISPGVLRRILQYIEGNLVDKLAVEELARDAGLSRSHFSRAFQAATGEPPQEFIIGRRICRARDMLSETDHNVAEIAALTGFSSQAHLSTAFKKRLGLTPARYREAFAGKQDTDD